MSEPQSNQSGIERRLLGPLRRPANRPQSNQSGIERDVGAHEPVWAGRVPQSNQSGIEREMMDWLQERGAEPQSNQSGIERERGADALESFKVAPIEPKWD